MQSILNIVCPHCQAKGQVAAPPTGAMVIGPCPKCNELVMVFSGAVLPLNKDVLMNGGSEDKRRHLMEVLTAFLDRQIGLLVQELEGSDPGEEQHSEFGEASENDMGMSFEEGYGDEGIPREDLGSETSRASREDASSAISQSEFEEFVRKALPMLDDKDYFRQTFNGD